MCCITFAAQISSLTNAAEREAQRHAAEIETERWRRQSELDEVSARVRAIVAKKDAQVFNAPASDMFSCIILLTGRDGGGEAHRRTENIQHNFCFQVTSMGEFKYLYPFHSTFPRDQIAHVHEQLDKARAELDAVKLSVEQQKRDLLRASFA
jgi:hypothetical protein